MDDGYEDAEGEDAEQDGLLALAELEFEEHGEGGNDTANWVLVILLHEKGG